MTVNIISESVYFPNFFRGMHMAFTNHVNLLKKSKIKVLINSLGKADVTHIHSMGLFALVKLLTSQRTVVSAHTLPATMVGTFKGSQYWGKLFQSYLIFFYNRADLLVLFSQYMADELRRIGVTTQMAIIPNTIDTNLFKPSEYLRNRGRKRFSIETDAFVVLGAGHLIPRKGIKDFIAVARELPSFTFVWVGDNITGLLQPGIEKTFLEKELPRNIYFLGNFPYRKMPSLFNIADVLFFPSYQETQGLVIVEAAACGLPLILRDLLEYRSLYDEKYIACKSNKQFKEALKRFATDKKALRDAKRKSLHLSQHFSLASVGNKLVDHYRSL